MVAKNNLIAACAEGIRRFPADSLNLQLRHNNFFSNGTNFFNYPSQYGGIIWSNANGTPADINYNIFQDPLFADLNTLTLGIGSPCIDAGDPAGQYLDGCFPPSLGTTVNDIGAYGGPFACGWFSPVLTNITLDIKQYIGVTINPPTPGLYRLEYAPIVGNSNLWTQITNVSLQSTPWTYIDYEAQNQGQRYYRGLLLPPPP